MRALKSLPIHVVENKQHLSNKKASKGFTLLEAVIALAIWMLLSVSVIFIWQFTSDRTNALIARQGVFENARGAMDVIIMQMQMASSIELWVGTDYTLQWIYLPGYDPEWVMHEFRIDFVLDTSSEHFQRLVFGRRLTPPNPSWGNEFARGIAMVRMEPVDRSRMDIRIVTVCRCTVIPVTLDDCECLVAPVILEGSVCIRHKALTVNGQPR